MIKPVIKRFDLFVTTAGASLSKTFELDKNIVSIRGLLLSSNFDDMLYFRGSQRIEINKEEIFPEGYESKLLMSGVNVSPNQKYYDLGGLNPGNGDVKVEYKDTVDARAAFREYRVSVYLFCDMDDTTGRA